MRTSPSILRIMLFLAGGMWFGSCGDFVRIDDSYQPPGGGNLSEFPQVTQLNHLVLAGVMRRYVVAQPPSAFVDYTKLAADNEARFFLSQYLGSLAATNPSGLSTESQRLAYWLNAYNAGVLSGVVSKVQSNPNYSVSNNDFLFFSEPNYTFGGIALTLDQVEHGVIRGQADHPSMVGINASLAQQIGKWHEEIWGAGKKVDPRIHAAINCAAVSCPNLLTDEPFVYRAETLEQQLAIQTKTWLDTPSKGAGSAGISMLFSWFKEDFVAAEGSVDQFIAKHRTSGLAGVDTSKNLEYDWSLNALP